MKEIRKKINKKHETDAGNIVPFFLDKKAFFRIFV